MVLAVDSEQDVCPVAERGRTYCNYMGKNLVDPSTMTYESPLYLQCDNCLSYDVRYSFYELMFHNRKFIEIKDGKITAYADKGTRRQGDGS